MRKAARKARGPSDPWEIAASAKRCMIGFNAGPPMMPSACHNNFQLFQTSDYDGNADAAFRICVS
jgi:hypothetical protein